MLELQGATWRYPSAEAPALGPVDLRVEPGELVLLTGPTGCGKSTLLRLAAGLLHRHGQGQAGGRVEVGGQDPAGLSAAARVRQVGFVSQEPADQIVSGTLGDEIAFALESINTSTEEIQHKIDEYLKMLGLPPEPDRSPRALSGGQRQRLVVASALAAGARLLLLDEPLAQLDPAGAQGLLAALRARADKGLALLMVEHRIEAALPWVDRVVVMDRGRIVGGFRPGHVDVSLLRRLGLSPPGLVELDLGLATRSLDRATALARLVRPLARSTTAWDGPVLAQLDDVSVRYGAHRALAGARLTLRAGDRVAVLGANGSGKSTLLSALSGRVRASGVRRVGRVVDVPQEPDLSLFCETVRDELDYGPLEARLAPAARQARVQAAAEGLSVADLLDAAPQALSRGQRLRVAVAAALTVGPDVLVLDEPTAGQDRGQVERLMSALGAALGEDAALLFATHDVELAARYARRWVVLDAGVVVAEGPPSEVMAALPAGGPLLVPPLLAWLAASGLPPASAAEVLSWLP